jgi:hypothetical protein
MRNEIVCVGCEVRLVPVVDGWPVRDQPRAYPMIDGFDELGLVHDIADLRQLTLSSFPNIKNGAIPTAFNEYSLNAVFENGCVVYVMQFSLQNKLQAFKTRL